MKAPIRVGIVGMGGYAGTHHDALIKLEEKKLARLVCTCDPQRAQFEAQQATWRLKDRGVYVFADHSSMLAACGPHLDLLVVPTPIQCHAAIHRAAVEAGLAVYVEKPPTLDYAELETMIELDRRGAKASLVGFNFIMEAPRQALKRRLVQGEFGALKEVRLRATWSRPSAYFNRCPSAGRLLLGEAIILDSCLSNELAHFVHNALFWAGTAEVMSWPELAGVRAELYRAHRIESADTACVEATTVSGVRLRIGASLAHAGPSTHSEKLMCEQAEIEYVVGRGGQIRWKTGATENIAWQPFDPLIENHVGYYRYLLGEAERPATTLEDSRGFVVLNNLAFISSGQIYALPPDRISLVCDPKEQKDYLSVAGLSEVLESFVSTGSWPSSQGWIRPSPSSSVTPNDLPRLRDTVRTMAHRVPANPPLAAG